MQAVREPAVDRSPRESPELEISSGTRFAFGKNWARFLSNLTDERVAIAEASLCAMFGTQTLEGKSLLDVGCGSGLFSLAARRLGARVHSFDYDPRSVACAEELRRRYFPGDTQWRVEQGSALDAAYLGRLGRFDIVYSWGVLHHTGAMWDALALLPPLLVPGGCLGIAIYNDQGPRSRRWLRWKQAYNACPRGLRWLIEAVTCARVWWKPIVRDTLRMAPLRAWHNYQRTSMRGMSPWRDVVDWAGGLPFEVAKPEAIFDFFRERGLILARLRTAGGGHGCNEFVFRAN